MNGVEIITTGDGSHSLFLKSLNETYHSHHGAMQESLYVFIRHGFDYIQEKKAGDIRILEIGFGTGLNAWLTLKANALHCRQVTYTSIEAFPLSDDVWRQLNYAEHGEEQMFMRLHETDWDKPVMLSEGFTLHKMHADLQILSFNDRVFDLIYFDAFAPNKQPEMWTIEILKKVTNALSTDGVFVTYCAKGQLKRDLKSLGLAVDTLPGPPGKKEMTRALRC